ncbi:MAG: hypothetical protein J6A01_04345 [Proteobacteria bacterium]|nr:hypothetical protein [Pseudomonadota bacterium]
MKKVPTVWMIASLWAVTGCMDADCPNGTCVENYGTSADFTVTRAPLEAICEIPIKGKGVKAMETDYLPNVVACENGSAPEESLKAQAIASRSFAYHRLLEGVQIYGDPSHDQAYTCLEYFDPAVYGLEKQQKAVDATSGIVMTYKGLVVCAYYVSGVYIEYLDSECKYNATYEQLHDPEYVQAHKAENVRTQHYVTYNEGKTGDDVAKREDGGDGITNRGCMTQYGANCLAKNRGYDWIKIIKFFYGDDIGYRQLQGSCIKPVTMDNNASSACNLDKSGVIIDEKDSCFLRTVSSTWLEGIKDAGYNKHYYYTYAGAEYEEVVGTWNLNVTRPGKYTVYAHYPKDVGAVSTQAPYTIRATGVEHKVNIDMTGKSDWVKLGDFDFAQGGDQWVKLSDLTGEAYTDPNGKRIIFDAIKFEDVISCTNACQEGEQTCEGSGYKVCQKGGDGCMVWSAVQACPEGQACSNNACAAVNTCTPECIAENLRECSGTGYHICSSVNGCLKWGDVIACDNGCDHGTCQGDASACENECEEGTAVCEDNGYKSCGQYDEDSCLEWSGVTACNAGETCVNGVCKADSEPTHHDTNCLTQIDGRPSTIIDETDGCFERNDGGNWQVISQFGYNHALYYAYLMDHETVGTWHFNVTKAGKYDVYVYVDAGIGGVPDEISYELKTSNRMYYPSVQTKDASGWVLVDTYALAEGTDQYIRLSNQVDGADDNQKRVVYDAVMIVPEGTAIEDDSRDAKASSSDCSANGTMNTSGMGGFVAILAALGSLVVLRRRRHEIDT